MSTWDEQFARHGVWESITQTKQSLDTTAEGAQDADLAEQHERLRRVVGFIESRLRATDPQLVGINILDGIGQSVDYMRIELEGFAASGNVAHLTNAQSYADQVIPTTSQLPPAPARTEDVQELQAAASSYRRSVSQLARNASDEVKKLSAETAKLQKELEAQGARVATQDARIDDVVAQAQTQFADVQSRGQTEINQAIADAQAAVNVAVSQAEASVEKTIVEAQTQMASALTATEANGVESIRKIEEQAGQTLESIGDTGDARIASLDELLEKAVKTVGAIGSTGMSGGYQIAAKQEDEQADRLRTVAIGALIGAAIISIGGLALSILWDFQWETVFPKTFAAVPLLLLAGYAASESGKHREQARIARQIELQLASLDSYLAVMEEEQQHRIKKRLADRFFGYVPSRRDRPPELAAPEAESS